MMHAPQLEDLLQEEKSENDGFINEVLKDFYICCLSREVSLLGRKEVLTGKAKFGILGDGKEVPQVAMARAFKKGDHRSGYYRDQTFMFALGLMTVEEFFAQLYADPENDPFSGGRQMNAHFATPYINEKGEWLDHRERYNVSADVSPTAGQMARALGLAYSSVKYRSNEALKDSLFSKKGNEVCFCTIGDASTSEGVFFETVNAAAVIKAPLAISIWDDGYGISVPRSLQTAKDSISKVLQGFAADDNGDGVYIFKAKAWNYPALVELYEKGIEKIRSSHLPGIFHIEEVTQPQGHSTSGSHERYKSEERLKWEEENDCIAKMADWIVDSGIAEKERVEEIREQGIQDAREGKKKAWDTFRSQINNVKSHFERKLSEFSDQLPKEETEKIESQLKGLVHPNWSEIVEVARDLRFALINHQGSSDDELDAFIKEQFFEGRRLLSHPFVQRD